MNGVFAVTVVVLVVATLAGFGSVMVMAAPPYPCTYTAYDSAGEVVRSVRRHTCVEMHLILPLLVLLLLEEEVDVGYCDGWGSTRKYDLSNMWRNGSDGQMDFMGTMTSDGSIFYVYISAPPPPQPPPPAAAAVYSSI